MKAYQPIGIFDSGYGGLTVLKEIVSQLPEYDYLYLGDNARAPYGTRSFETVYHFSLEAVQHLFNQGCSLVILACNTASAKALRTIQQKDLPGLAREKRVLGVIRPTTELVGNLTQTNHIGVLGTAGTINSFSYPMEINRLFPEVKVFQQACPMWVPLIENNEFETEGADFFIRKYIRMLLDQSPKIDTIILGCTHYPLLLNQITARIPSHIKVISQGQIVAESLSAYLKRHPEIEKNCSKGASIQFFTTETPENFDAQASRFFGSDIKSQHASLKQLF